MCRVPWDRHVRAALLPSAWRTNPDLTPPAELAILHQYMRCFRSVPTGGCLCRLESDFLLIHHAQHWKFYGLVFQNNPMFDDNGRPDGIMLYLARNITIERTIVRHLGGGRGLISTRSDSIRFINCDVYDISNTYQQSTFQPGLRGGGIIAHGPQDAEHDFNWGTVFVEGCRVWDIANSGIGSAYNARMVINNSWAIDIEARSFLCSFSGHMHPDDSTFVLTNSISFNARTKAFHNNNNNDSYSPGIRVYNNTSIHHRASDRQDNVAVHNAAYSLNMAPGNQTPGIDIKNNVSYLDASDQHYWQNRSVANVTQDYNSWNNGLSLTDADFVGPLDKESLRAALKAPRKADGSLPDLPNLMPSETSQLLNAGTNVGFDYFGEAPDLGAFQFDPAKLAAILLFK